MHARTATVARVVGPCAAGDGISAPTASPTNDPGVGTATPTGAPTPYLYHFEFDELQIGGGAHLVFWEPKETKVEFYFHAMIGDRTGVLHIGDNQALDMD